MMEVAYEMHKSKNKEAKMRQKKVSFSFQC